ncbi:efflux RND transporter periplasmic adaptor subunit [bacterium]|nr:efflux RND transporter periplasmic adaptor subunit [bacterium]
MKTPCVAVGSPWWSIFYFDHSSNVAFLKSRTSTFTSVLQNISPKPKTPSIAYTSANLSTPRRSKLVMTTETNNQPRIDGRLIGIMILILIAVVAYGTQPFWIGPIQTTVAYLKNESDEEPAMGHESHSSTDHDETAAGHVAHDSPDVNQNLDSIKLTEAAWTNIGLVTGVVETAEFASSNKLPAIIVERPGRSLIQIPAPVTGVVTKVFAVEQDSVSPGDPLFELRLTHEDVVTAQTSFLEHLHHRERAKKELDRLRSIGSKIIAGKRIIEQEYQYEEESERVEGLRQSLLMHGLLEDQVDDIESSRKFLRTITVSAPPFADSVKSDGMFYHLQKMQVSRGQIVEAGHSLAVLADHRVLFVEGQAFEEDAQQLFHAASTGTTIKVVPSTTGAATEQSLNLKIHSVSDRVDPKSRALKFYLLLPNEKLAANKKAVEGDEGFLGWKYRPGQRMQAYLTSGETFANEFVLPAEAVVIDGPNAFIFEQNGDYFDRVDVSVLYRDSDTVVVKKDNRLIGSVIAMTAAFDMHLALKNAAGGPVDPHAGHTH